LEIEQLLGGKMNNKTVFGVLATAFALSYGPSVSAELLASAASKAEEETFEVGVSFVDSTVTLKGSDSNIDNTDVDRQMIPVYAAYGLNDMMDAYAGVAMILKSEAEDVNGDGDGLAWGGGIRGNLPFGDEFTLRGYAQFLYISEEYDDGLKGNGWFLDVGALAMYEASDDLNIYGGLELAPTENFELKTSGQYSGGPFDLERDDLLTIRLGAKFNMDTFFLRGEAAFAGEQSFTIGAGMPL